MKQVVAEPGARSPEDYARRVLGLAVLYPTMTLGAIAGEVLLAWRGKMLVTLAQRSNVETLVLAFFAVFFAYVGFLAIEGAPGGVRILAWRALARIRGTEAVERSKHERLGPPRGEGPFAALNVAIEQADHPGERFSLAVGDRFGTVARIEIDGACIRDVPSHRDGSSNLLAYFAHQVQQVAGTREGRRVDIVAWGTLDDEETLRFLASVEFARNLGSAIGHRSLWPTVVLGKDDCAELQRRLSAVCPAIREEAFLPDWEYQAEHKLPIVPEPLGLVSLGRTEKRADPLPALSALTLVLLAAVATLAIVIAAPPWVPGK